MADVTGRIGDQDVALDNAATEATLKDLLAAIKGQTSTLSRLSSTAGAAGINPQAIAAANKGVQQMGAAQQAGVVAGKALGMAFSGLSKGAMILGGVLGDIVASGVQTGKNLTDLAGKMLDGGGKVSDVFAAFKDLPLGIGLVAGLFQKLVEMQEAQLASYQDMTKSGVNFGGALMEIQQTALDMGTTLEGFGKLVKENSTLFAQLGSTADAGARSFVNLSKDIRNSEVGKNLRALGFSIDDINSSTANYLKMTGGRTAEEMKNTRALADSAGAYMKQLDMLSTITGKSREEQEKALAEASNNAAYEAYLQTLDEEGRKKATAALQNALAVGGKGAADALKSQLLGLPPMTEAAQNFTALLPNAAKGVADMGNAVKDSSKNLKDVNKSYSQAMVGSAQDAKNLGKEQIAAASFGNAAMAETMMQAQKNQNILNSKQIKNAEDFDKLQADIATSAEARKKSEAAAAAELQQRFKDLGAQLFGMLAPAINELLPVITKLAEEMIGFAMKNMPAIKEGLKMVVDFVKDLFSPEGREKVGKQIAEGLGKLLQMAWDNFSLFGKKNQPDAESSAYNPAGYDAGSIPGAADGGIVKARPGGQLIKAAEVGMNEAFVPLPDGNKIPVKLDLNTSDFGKIYEEIQALRTEVLTNAKEKSEPANTSLTSMFSGFNELISSKSNKPSTTEQSGSTKDLVAELQQLNKQTAQMLAYMRETTDFSRRNLDAIRGLNGNLLI